jgi:hypothetical protein
MDYLSDKFAAFAHAGRMFGENRSRFMLIVMQTIVSIAFIAAAAFGYILIFLLLLPVASFLGLALDAQKKAQAKRDDAEILAEATREHSQK